MKISSEKYYRDWAMFNVSCVKCHVSCAYKNPHIMCDVECASHIFNLESQMCTLYKNR